MENLQMGLISISNRLCKLEIFQDFLLPGFHIIMALIFKISVRNFVYCSIGTFEKEKHKKNSNYINL